MTIEPRALMGEYWKSRLDDAQWADSPAVIMAASADTVRETLAAIARGWDLNGEGETPELAQTLVEANLITAGTSTLLVSVERLQTDLIVGAGDVSRDGALSYNRAAHSALRAVQVDLERAAELEALDHSAEADPVE